jgi:hypothetical protein
MIHLISVVSTSILEANVKLFDRSIEATHFRTLYNGLCGIHSQLQANHEESMMWMRELYGSVEEKHEDSNRNRIANHYEALRATGDVGKKADDLVVAVVVAETVTLVAIGVWWYFWRGSVERKHEEARGWMQDSNWSRMRNHDESMKATMEVGKKIDDLVMGLIVTGLATVVAMAATGLWWYFWGRKVDEKKVVTMSKKMDVQEASKKDNPSLKQKPALKPKPALMSKPALKPKPLPKSETRMQWPVPAIERNPFQAAPGTPATHNIRPSTAIKLIEEHTTTTTNTTRQGNDCTKKGEQFANVMTELKIQLDKKARNEVDIGV